MHILVRRHHINLKLSVVRPDLDVLLSVDDLH